MIFKSLVIYDVLGIQWGQGPFASPAPNKYHAITLNVLSCSPSLHLRGGVRGGVS